MVAQALACGIPETFPPIFDSRTPKNRLEGFSVERLVQFLNALGRDVEIVIRGKPRSRPNSSDASATTNRLPPALQ